MSSYIRQAFVIAGGMGTRMKPVYQYQKVLTEFNGTTVAERLIGELVNSGIEEIVFLLGYNAESVVQYLNRIMPSSQVSIKIVREETPLGTGGALIGAVDYMQEHFIVVYGDLLIKEVVNDLIDSFEMSRFDASIAIRPTNHPHDSDIVETSKSVVTQIHTKPHIAQPNCRPLGNTGVYILSKKLFNGMSLRKLDLDRDLVPNWLSFGWRIQAHITSGFVRDFGTPERLNEVSEVINFVETTFFPRKAIFLDRDDTLIRDYGVFTNLHEPNIFPDAFPFLQAATRKGYLVFVISNQPSIAKGFVSVEATCSFHAKIEWQVAGSNSSLQEILFCPHHPESGHEGENAQFKTDCGCRKPKTGLIDEVLQRYSIKLSDSLLIGDSWRDEKLADAMNLHFYSIDRNCSGKTDCQHIHSLVDVIALL